MQRRAEWNETSVRRRTPLVCLLAGTDLGIRVEHPHEDDGDGLLSCWLDRWCDGDSVPNRDLPTTKEYLRFPVSAVLACPNRTQ